MDAIDEDAGHDVRAQRNDRERSRQRRQRERGDVDREIILSAKVASHGQKLTSFDRRRDVRLVEVTITLTGERSFLPPTCRGTGLLSRNLC